MNSSLVNFFYQHPSYYINIPHWVVLFLAACLIIPNYKTPLSALFPKSIKHIIFIGFLYMACLIQLLPYNPENYLETQLNQGRAEDYIFKAKIYEDRIEIVTNNFKFPELTMNFEFNKEPKNIEEIAAALVQKRSEMMESYESNLFIQTINLIEQSKKAPL